MKAENLHEFLIKVRELQGVVMMLDMAYQGKFTIPEKEGVTVDDTLKAKLKPTIIENLINRKNELIEKLKSL